MLLPTIGTRLRTRRQDMGLTQSSLAKKAGVSPRFLVQLEGGTGNISVQRLAEVCTVLDLSLATLFQGLGPGRPQVVALVGLRGAGKSSVGAAVADRLGMRFVELDQMVEAEAGMTLGEIFEMRGEAYFREVESRVLDRMLTDSDGQGLVVATGGSIVTSPATWRKLREATHTVWLQASPATHLARVQAQGDLRPMRGRPDARGELEEILRERGPLYAQADTAVDTDVLPLKAVVRALTDQLQGATG